MPKANASFLSPINTLASTLYPWFSLRLGSKGILLDNKSPNLSLNSVGLPFSSILQNQIRMYNKYPRSRSVFCQLVILAAFFEGGVCGQHNAYIKRSTAELSSAYDYVILGGGTSGLTVADRLTEDPSSKWAEVILNHFMHPVH